jgi:hypothetical protein
VEVIVEAEETFLKELVTDLEYLKHYCGRLQQYTLEDETELIHWKVINRLGLVNAETTTNK